MHDVEDASAATWEGELECHVSSKTQRSVTNKNVPRLKFPVNWEEAFEVKVLSTSRQTFSARPITSARVSASTSRTCLSRPKVLHLDQAAAKSYAPQLRSRNSAALNVTRIDKACTARCTIPVHHPSDAHANGLLFTARGSMTERHGHAQQCSKVSSLASVTHNNIFNMKPSCLTVRGSRTSRQWSSVGVAVYRVGIGMYHSSLAVDDTEWHFWEGLGVVSAPRYYDPTLHLFRSVDHMPFVTYIPMSTVAVPASVIANLCQRFGSSTFTLHNYDLLRCNCNHFTQAVLERLGLVYSMPRWINRLAVTADAICTRLPVVRRWIDATLDRKARGIARQPDDGKLSGSITARAAKITTGQAKGQTKQNKHQEVSSRKRHTEVFTLADCVIVREFGLTKGASAESIESNATTVGSLCSGMSKTDR